MISHQLPEYKHLRPKIYQYIDQRPSKKENKLIRKYYKLVKEKQINHFMI